MTEQAQPPIILNIRVTMDGLNYILGAVAKGPFEQVSDLITDLRTQALAQLEQMKADDQTQAANSDAIQHEEVAE